MKETEFESEILGQLRREAKVALRKRLGALRRALPAGAVAERSARIVAQLLEHPWILAARAVGLYAAMPDRGEVTLAGLHEVLLQGGVSLYYPFMDKAESGYRTGFRLLRKGEPLTIRAQRFAEPDPAAPAAHRGDIDVVVVPALGLTLNGARLGTGSGFYDATLPDLCPPAKSIVVGYEFQLLVEVPTEAHDFVCDGVVTDAPNR